MNKNLTLEELELVKEIAHTTMHRMNWWQYLWKGGYFRRQYDEACARKAQIQEEKQ